MGDEVNAKQINQLAHDIRHRDPNTSIEAIIARYVADAKEAEDDVAWLQGLVAGAVKAGLPGCHAETHRMIRILKRLENEVRK